MYSIILAGIDKINAAAEWCNQNLNYGEWQLTYDQPWASPPRYEFKFFDPEIANIFSLKWM
jgi:hypothetical protein